MKLCYSMMAILLTGCSVIPVSEFDATDVTNVSEPVDTTSFYSALDGNVRRLLACAADQRRSVVVSHRGGFAPGYPENSLASFERVLKAIPTILEVDIVTTSDGIDFMHHDDDLIRTTNGYGAVVDASWSTVSQLRMKDNSGQLTSQNPVSFETTLSALAGRAFLMLDLKAPKSTKKIVLQVEAADMTKSTIFIAYSFDQARQILAAVPDALIALGADSENKINNIYTTELGNQDFVALTGPFKPTSEPPTGLSNRGHHVLVGSNLGENSPDSRLSVEERIPEFDNAGENGVRLIVSNRPLQLHRYQVERSIQFDPSACSL